MGQTKIYLLFRLWTDITITFTLVHSASDKVDASIFYKVGPFFRKECLIVSKVFFVITIACTSIITDSRRNYFRKFTSEWSLWFRSLTSRAWRTLQTTETWKSKGCSQKSSMGFRLVMRLSAKTTNCRDDIMRNSLWLGRLLEVQR